VRRERGSATVELAAGLPVLVVLLLTGCGAVLAVLAKVRCVDAAREAALAAARGEPGAAAGARAAPEGADVVVAVDGGLVRARVRVDVRPLGPHLPGFEVGAEAVAAVEPS
jgi:Flp pilus assembly protein TadG